MEKPDIAIARERHPPGRLGTDLVCEGTYLVVSHHPAFHTPAIKDGHLEV
jgi:hypothetical protein